ncbi:Carboxylic ester hydrolase [Pleurotus pulmonarius]
MLAFSLALLLPALCNGVPVVEVDGTTIMGRTLQHSGQDVFRGIPYAEPPVGARRFRPPHPKKLPALLNAAEFGVACLQPFAQPDTQMSEDCLTLNIQRPPGTNGTNAYPVMVWIHGGGFYIGSASDSNLNATDLISYSVTRGTPIVYVNLNYRLGGLGFPQGARAIDRGSHNLGLKDQLLAIQWVHDHIAAFGGDPKKVTLFGESAGAFSTATHLFNPAIEGLIAGVILESGTAKASRAELREGFWQRFSAAADCDEQDPWDWLMAADSDVLLKATKAVTVRDAPLDFVPVIDGDDGLIPDFPSRLYEAGKFAKVPVLSGVNLDEGSVFAPEYTSSSEEIRARLIATYLSSAAVSQAQVEEVVDKLMEIYPDIPALGSPYNTGNETFGLSSQYKRLGSLLGDLAFVAPVRLHLRALAKADVQVYSYLFTENSGARPPQEGIAHTDEIAYVYGQPPVPVSSSSARLTGLVMDYWLSFAYEQHPNDGRGHNRPEWLPYTEGSPVIMQLNGVDLRMIPDNYREEQINFIISKADILGL